MSSEDRTRNPEVVKRIVFGNTSRYTDRTDSQDRELHDWIIFVRSFENENMSTYIREVQFGLPKPYGLRTVTEPPYEISDCGWKEFNVKITLVFCDKTQIVLNHRLCLVKKDEKMPVEVGRFIYSEQFDEIVFANPSDLLYAQLIRNRRLPPHLWETHNVDYEQKEKDTTEALKSARSIVKQEIQSLTVELINKMAERSELLDRMKSMGGGGGN